jgi:hypothetical protein
MRALLVTIVALAVSPAAADSVEDAAQVHLDRGVAAFEQGDFLVAHREIAAAHDLVPDKPNPYRWLALVEVQLGDCVKAQANITAFLARVPETDERRAEMLRLRELCSRTGALAIRTTPEKAELRIDGAHVGPAPYRSGAIAVGEHTIIADAPGYEPLSRAVVVTAQQDLDVHLALSRPRRPITQRWWFVPALVGAAVIVTGSIILATRGDDEPTLPGVICDATGCRPGGS